MKYTPEQYELGRKLRDKWVELSGYDVDWPRWENLEASSREDWVRTFFESTEDRITALAQKHVREETEANLEEKAKKIRERNFQVFADAEWGKANTDRSYSFVSASEDVDLLRISKEVPEDENPPCILVETRDRNTNEGVGWTLLVHEDLLKDILIKDFCLHEAENSYEDRDHVGLAWGDGFVDSEGNPSAYRKISGSGKFPGRVKQQIEQIKRALNPKSCVTSVRYA